jgi:hypothetical protein
MTEADRQRCAAAMASLGVAFDVVVTAQRQRLYFEALQDLPIDAVEWGAKAAIRELNFFPRAKELRDFAKMAPAKVWNGPSFSTLQRAALPEPPMPVEKQRALIRGMAEELNSQFGTAFRVDESMGRPALAPGRRENVT